MGMVLWYSYVRNYILCYVRNYIKKLHFMLGWHDMTMYIIIFVHLALHDGMA